VASASASFAFQSDEAGATFECRLDGGRFAPCGSPATLAELSEGVHVFELRAVDGWGNVDPTPAYRRWTVDLTPPQTRIDRGPGALSVERSTSFAFSADETDARFECSLDGGSFEPCGLPHELAGLTDGEHSLAVRAVDLAGNVDASPARWEWTHDATAPETTITSGPSAATRRSSATIAFSSPDSAATFRCRLDGGELEPCASPRELAGLAEGEHTFRGRGRGSRRQRRFLSGRPPLEGRYDAAADGDHLRPGGLDQEHLGLLRVLLERAGDHLQVPPRHGRVQLVHVPQALRLADRRAPQLRGARHRRGGQR